MISLSRYSKLILTGSSIISLVLVSNLVRVNSARAFSVTFTNGGFEDSPDPLNGWETIGDVSTTISNAVQANNGDIGFVNPIAGNNQAIVTTGHTTRIDDIDSSVSTLNFNQSGSDPVDSDTIAANNSGNDFQTQLGLNIGDLSIDRVNGNTATVRTSKEASAIYQDINITIDPADETNGTNGFQVNFNWAYLTNDGDNGDLGNQDYSFVSIYDVTSGTDTTVKNIELLGDSDQSIIAPTANDNYSYGNTTYYTGINPYMTEITGLAAGDYTYRVAFGVVDVDNLGRSSALVLDEFNVEQVPFEFSPTAGIALVIGLFGCDRLRRRIKNKK